MSENLPYVPRHRADVEVDSSPRNWPRLRKHLGQHPYSLHRPDSRYASRICRCQTGTGHY